MEVTTKKKSGFFRTLAGKTVLFITINLSLILLCASVLGFAFALAEDIYHTTPEQYKTKLSERNIEYQAKSLADSVMSPYGSYYSYIPIKIQNDKGIVLYRSPTFDALENSVNAGDSTDLSCYTFHTSIIYNSNGSSKGLVGFNPFLDTDTTVSATITVYVDPNDYSYLTPLDLEVIGLIYKLSSWLLPIAIISFFLSLISFITLMSAAGKRPGSDEIAAGPLSGIPFDVLLAGVIFLGAIGAVIMNDVNTDGAAIMGGGLILITLLNLCIGLAVSMAGRVKRRMLIKGSLIYKIIMLTVKFLKFIWKGITAIPLIWGTAIAVAVLSIIELIYLATARYDGEALVGGWFVEKLIFVPFILYIAYILKKLAKAGEKIAQGDITYRAPTKGLWGDFKKHAENLNAVSDSVTIAVEDRLKSERMKTELITNVSHDIKTPLTSIINYASLIGESDPSDPKIGEYSEVIVRQSDKLKRLIEDLVEASKASTGNLEIVPSPLDCCTFVSQTAGEFKEKLDSANLTLITNVPEEKVMIMADGRRMMRIYDNLMNNICKYSMPGTRVYISLNVVSGQAVTVFKNTSSAELNISPDELVERFVRGDQSRNTEGNGLGLSIAQSLTELQGGKFKVEIDGDLFKVTLTFPVIQ